MRIRAVIWKNDRAAVRAVRTKQYNNLLFYLLLMIIYYSTDLPSSLKDLAEHFDGIVYCFCLHQLLAVCGNVL
jgi:hypothetical protein